jgi:hypothetical protein
VRGHKVKAGMAQVVLIFTYHRKRDKYIVRIIFGVGGAVWFLDHCIKGIVQRDVRGVESRLK